MSRWLVEFVIQANSPDDAVKQAEAYLNNGRTVDFNVKPERPDSRVWLWPVANPRIEE